MAIVLKMCIFALEKEFQSAGNFTAETFSPVVAIDSKLGIGNKQQVLSWRYISSIGPSKQSGHMASYVSLNGSLQGKQKKRVIYHVDVYSHFLQHNQIKAKNQMDVKRSH